jgi:hypothetical protein
MILLPDLYTCDAIDDKRFCDSMQGTGFAALPTAVKGTVRYQQLEATVSL